MREQIRPHRRLDAWKEAMELVKAIYEITAQFPTTEIYGLSSQMRRAAVSIPSNLAEGAARTSGKEFAQFLSLAKGSISELETQLLIAVDLKYMRGDHSVFAQLERCSKLITGLHKKVIQ
jgi:four helix bundle protein